MKYNLKKGFYLHKCFCILYCIVLDCVSEVNDLLVFRFVTFLLIRMHILRLFSDQNL